jgi:hypothetical protein
MAAFNPSTVKYFEMPKFIQNMKNGDTAMKLKVFERWEHPTYKMYQIIHIT